MSADFSRFVIAGGLATAGVTIAGTRFANRFLINSLLPDGVIDVALLADGVRLPFAGLARVVDAGQQSLSPSLDDCGTDAAAIATALRRGFGADAVAWTAMSDAAADLAKADFAPASIAAQWAKIYDDLLAGAGSRVSAR